jgi:hypothetical protein
MRQFACFKEDHQIGATRKRFPHAGFVTDEGENLVECSGSG